jgi:hypothetical protein
MASATAFVVNLPQLRRGVLLCNALTEDGFDSSRSPRASAFLTAVEHAGMRDLPEYVPITSTPTETITEDTRMRVANRVYICNVTLMLQEQELPFVQHWQYSDGVPLRALVVRKEIQNLPETHLAHKRVVLQNYVYKIPCEVGLAIIDALTMSIPRHGTGKGKGKHAEEKGNTRARIRNWSTLHRQIAGLRAALVHEAAARIAHGPLPSAEWASVVAGLHPASPEDFARRGGDGVCVHGL